MEEGFRLVRPGAGSVSEGLCPGAGMTSKGRIHHCEFFNELLGANRKMEIVLWAIAIVLWALALWLIVLNHACILLGLKQWITGKKTRNCSWIPLVGSVLALLGAVVSPIGFSWPWLLVLILDPGTIGIIPSLLYVLCRVYLTKGPKI